jgi:Mannosyltransferase (PIG-V)
MQTHNQLLSTQEAASPLATIVQDWRTALMPWWKATLVILPLYLITRLGLLMLTYFGAVLFTLPASSDFALSFNSVLYSWDHWDAARYLTIAGSGYIDQSYTSFFPLYPTLVHLISTLTHRDILLVSMCISNLAFLGVSIVFFRLVSDEFDAEIARRSVLYLSIFPTALFFFAAYDVALFLLFVLLCFYSLRKGAWWLAGVFGGLAALTHFSGLLLFVIFLCEFLRQQYTPLRQSWQDKKKVLFRLAPLLAAFLIPLSFAIYAYALKKKFADALIFLHQPGGAHLSAPWSAPLAAVRILLHTSLYTSSAVHSLLDLILFVLTCLVLVLCCIGPYRLAKKQWPLTLCGFLFLLSALFFPALPGNTLTFDPMPVLPYTSLSIFVVFIMLARLNKHVWIQQAFMLLSLPLFSFLVLQLITNHWTF